MSSKIPHKGFSPPHGGALSAAAEHFQIPHQQWLDISTGINPNSWPVPEIPTSVWQRLPEEHSSADHTEPSLHSIALNYYLNTDALDADCDISAAEKPAFNRSHILPCAGSQQAIRLLPCLYNAWQKHVKPGQKTAAEAKVWVTSGSYSEHGLAWEEQGHRVCKVACDRISQLLTQQPVDVLILINPDNPSGHRWPPEQLLKWWSILQRRGGWLIVDEAFMDMTPEQSLVHHGEREGLFVLRSVGKFFGLAGIRLGFVFAAEKSIRRLDKMLGPWAISHPAQYIAKLALQDQHWIEQQKQVLSQQTERLKSLLENHFPYQIQGTDLFCSMYFSDAEQVFQQLAEQGVLTRYLAATATSPAGIRFGLPQDNQASWQQLERALAKLK